MSSAFAEMRDMTCTCDETIESFGGARYGGERVG